MIVAVRCSVIYDVWDLFLGPIHLVQGHGSSGEAIDYEIRGKCDDADVGWRVQGQTYGLNDGIVTLIVNGWCEDEDERLE